MDGRDQDSGTADRPRLRGRDVLVLIWQTYAVSFPYLLVFVLLFLIATWVVTAIFS